MRTRALWICYTLAFHFILKKYKYQITASQYLNVWFDFVHKKNGRFELLNKTRERQERSVDAFKNVFLVCVCRSGSMRYPLRWSLELCSPKDNEKK